MDSTTIRVSQATSEKLREIATEAGLPLQTVLDRALDAYWRERFFGAVDTAYEALRADPIAWQEELDERKLLEGTLADDLDEP